MICEFPELLRLVAAHSRKDIDDVPQYVALCRQNENNRLFEMQRAILLRVRQTLDMAVDPQPTFKGQARRAVMLLEQNRGGADFEWYHELISAAYRPQWPEAQQTYFERAVRRLRMAICDFPELIALFAEYSVKEINVVADYVALCRLHEKNRQFQEQRHTVERIKAALEELLDAQPTYRLQVREALIKLQKNRGEADFEWYYEMIVAAYKRRWSDAQQEYFDQAVGTIRSGNEFFLSFTSRPKETGNGTEADKPVNRRYWYFIRSVISNISPDDRKRSNLLAETVYTLLRDESLHGFYYKAHEGDNRQVRADLLEGCATARVFIQLVQNVMFERPEQGLTNYCEFEYRQAYNAIIDGNPDNEDRILFVMAEDKNAFIGANRVLDPYSDWHKHILQKDRPSLPRVDTYDQAKIAQIHDTFEKLILPQVRSAWDKLLDRIP